MTNAVTNTTSTVQQPQIVSATPMAAGSLAVSTGAVATPGSTTIVQTPGNTTSTGTTAEASSVVNSQTPAVQTPQGSTAAGTVSCIFLYFLKGFC